MDQKNHTVDVVELLESRNISQTQQRIRIAQVLCARPRHMSAEQILALVNQERTRVSKATIYNTLNLFVSKGLVREIIVDPEKVFYDSTTRPHHHYYNEDTGEITDIEDEVALSQLPKAPEGTEIVNAELIVRIRNR